MKLDLNFDDLVEYDKFSLEEQERLKSQLSETLKKEGISDFSNNSIEKLLKLVETNKKSLFGSLRLWRHDPKLENTLALVICLNEQFKVNKDLRLLNASLKLIDLLLHSHLSEMNKSMISILAYQCKFVKTIELDL